ncbi:MAG: hypothetical protein VYC20_05985, partial [Pseudomonadota bacterium]|nr:hypothetical protein [Pseudomonadota bacterium]
MPDASRSVAKKVLAGDLRCLVVTFAIALSSGWVCLQLGIPAPYLWEACSVSGSAAALSSRCAR